MISKKTWKFSGNIGWLAIKLIDYFIIIWSRLVDSWLEGCWAVAYIHQIYFWSDPCVYLVTCKPRHVWSRIDSIPQQRKEEENKNGSLTFSKSSEKEEVLIKKNISDSSWKLKRDSVSFYPARKMTWWLRQSLNDIKRLPSRPLFALPRRDNACISSHWLHFNFFVRLHLPCSTPLWLLIN